MKLPSKLKIKTKANNMKVSLKKAFSILDGRLSTQIGDVYEMLNYIFDDNLFTHQLPTAMRILQDKNPKWFEDGINIINGIKKNNKTDDFFQLMNIIDNEFENYQIDLIKIDSKVDFKVGLESFI